MQSPEEPQTIFDLTLEEFDFLTMYRKLSPKNKVKFNDFIYELTKDIMPER